MLPAVAANAVYEGSYLMGTSLARPLIGRRLAEVARDEGERMANPRWRLEGVSDDVRSVVVDYAAKPTHVARMVTMGHALARWLDASVD